MKEKEVILGLSFGFKKDGPGFSNEALAEVIDREQIKNPDTPSILHLEIAACVKRRPLFMISRHRKYGQNLDSEEAIDQAISYARKRGFSVIKLVAHPFLHRQKCWSLLKKYGIKVKIVKTGWIPFDKDSEQWYTRGPVRCLLYAFLQFFTGRKGY